MTNWEQLELNFMEPALDEGETNYERDYPDDAEPADQYWIDRAGAAEDELEAANETLNTIREAVKKYEAVKNSGVSNLVAGAELARAYLAIREALNE